MKLTILSMFFLTTSMVYAQPPCQNYPKRISNQFFYADIDYLKYSHGSSSNTELLFEASNHLPEEFKLKFVSSDVPKNIPGCSFAQGNENSYFIYDGNKTRMHFGSFNSMHIAVRVCVYDLANKLVASAVVCNNSTGD